MDQLDKLLSISTFSASQIETELSRVSRLRQAVLKWAFEGRLVDQDPKDEPAERLLARIRAERAAVTSAVKVNGRRRKGAA